MADKPEFEIDGKLLSQLRVVDLKLELEKRGLSKSGTKKDLHDRLKMQMQLESLQKNVHKDEGHVPNLALQDDAIAEQSDVIKEYLAKQQQVYEMQKNVRRQVELEEEMEKSKLAKQMQEQSERTAEVQEVVSTPVQNTEGSTAAEPPAGESIQSEVKESPSVTSEQIETSVTTPEVIAREPEKSSLANTEQEMKKDIQEEPKEILSKPDIEEMSMKVEAITELKQPGFVEMQVESENSTVHVRVERSVSHAESSPIVAGKQAEPELPVDASKDSLSASGGGNGAKSAEEVHPPTTEEVRTFRPRIRREFFHPETSRESPELPKEIAEQSKPESMDVTETEIVSSVADSSVDVQKETVVPGEQVTSRISRRQMKRRSSSNQKEEPKKSLSRSRSHSSDSNSSLGRTTSQRKSSHASTSSRSSSVESRKSQTSVHQESDSIFSSGTSKKKPKRLIIKYEQSPSPVSKMSEGEAHDSSGTRQNKESSETDREQLETQGKSVSRLGEDNEESLDLETKPEETLETQTSSEKEVANNSVGIVHVRKISLSSSRDNSNKENVEASEGERPMRKRKWGSIASKNAPKTSYTISTDSLKTLIPDVKPSTSAAAVVDIPFDPMDTPPSDHDENVETVLPPPKEVRIVRTVTQVVRSDDVPMANQEKPKNDTVQYKPLSLMEDPIARPRTPSPARNAVNCIVHIRNLVRPFTLKQLKDLLSKTGTLVESGFWIDKIKSKCYATYENIEQAVETRQTLHGTQWPPSNRKNLIVDYADEDELRFHMSLEFSTEPPKPPEKYTEPLARDMMMIRRGREMVTSPTSKNKDFGPVLPPPPIREWDREKIGERSPGERERRKRMMSPLREKRREKGRGMKERKERRDKRKEEEEAPAKLLDDLFRKTKITPCIYWLPLTSEQINLREEERKQRQVEREKRRQQIKKDDDTTEKGKPAASRDTKKIKTEEVSHRKRSPPPTHSRTRKR